MRSKIILLFFFVLISAAGFSQPAKGQISRNSLPLLVKEAFLTKFPASPKAIWRSPIKDQYEVEIVIENTINWITYNEFGVLLFTKKVIQETDLPEEIKQNLMQQFSDHSLQLLKKVEHTEKGASFEIETKRQEEKFILVFEGSGALISQTAVLE